MPLDYYYLGCPRCGEITLVQLEKLGARCTPCLMEGVEIDRLDEKQLRKKAMSLFRQGQPMQGRACEALASAIKEATIARVRVRRNTYRIEENDY